MVRLAALTVLFAVLGLTAHPANAQNLNISVQNLRHAYYRGETVPFSIQVQNLSNRPLRKVRVRADISAFPAKDLVLDIPAGGRVPVTYEVDTTPLRSQDYQLAAAAVHGEEMAMAAFPFTVAHRPNPQRLPVVYWGGSSGVMDWGLAHGFNTFSIGSIQTPPDSEAVLRSREAFDEATRKGFLSPRVPASGRWRGRRSSTT